jgi:uncharacterized membrane protein
VLSILSTGLIGLLGTLLGGWLTYQQQQATARRDHEKWKREHRADEQRRAIERDDARREMRRSAAVAFVRHVDAHREACRAYWDAVDRQAPEADLTTARNAYVNSWDALALELAAFQLAASPDVSVEGGALYNAVRDYSEAVDRVARDVRGAGKHAESVQEALFVARRRFISAAQGDLAAKDAAHAIEVPAV